MFIPGCGCCGCKPCPYCSPSCLTATFSGFDHGTENCNECKFLDGTTFVLKRPPTNGRNHFLGVTAVDADGPDEGETANGSGASFGQPGVTANGTITNVARRADGSYYVTAVTISSGGSGYDTPTLTFTPTRFIECRKPTVSVTVTSGAITAVTVEEGGEYWLDTSCVYFGESCAVCPEHAGQTLTATLTIGSTSNTIEISRGATVIVSATQSNTDDEDAPIPCDGFTFEAENVTGCMTNGTISIASGECGDSSISACDLPDSITLTTSGVGPIFLWSAQSGGQPPEDPFDGQCEASYVCLLRGTGNAVGPSTWNGFILKDFSFVLDRQPGCGIVYQGYSPAFPIAGGFSGQVNTVDCGGGIDPNALVTVSISPAGLGTNVVISGPSWGSFGAEAEATVGGGAVTSITVTNPGEGYAREIFTRTEPDMAVTLSASTGTGAVLEATLTQTGTGEAATWAVTSVAVTNGGTGYTGTESVVFTPEAGATTQDPAYGYMITGRTTPTVTASASAGSGASLSVTLTQSTDWNGLDVWGVSAVNVTSGGAGYTDGSEVTFTVTDGVAVYGASATIAVGREEPTVTASVPAPSAGTGAVLAVTLTASGTSWTVSGLTITSGGSGYAAGDSIALATGDTEESGGYAIVDTVNGSGAITAVTIYSGGSYYRSTGVIESVSIGWGGEYFKSTGVITSVVVEYGGGAYFISTSTGTAEVDTPTVTITSNIGRDATATATVDATVGSATFGQITGVTVTNGGEEYKMSGTGWKLSIALGNGFGHADEIFGECEEVDSYREEVYVRVTADHCPSALLQKSYKMFTGRGIPFGIDSACGTYCVAYTPNPYAVFMDFGSGDITASIS